ncbi:MAG: 16S rRNA (guanine(527)-N(7))-methyltransferase RsmG [Lachnoclostridium sp.]|nr:16S rRNA (guanine(527)-N(7))-methyltransferase RsmG [Lachnoclostridium sp.]
MEELLSYFPDLTPEQQTRLAALGPLYREWNEKINVISRKDIDNLFVHHILHSMSIAKFVTPIEGTTVMDLGTGGGFPGIPLAILWPQCRFHLIDRIGKKVGVARSIAEEIGLTNVTFQHGDSGECHEKFDYVVSRAVMQLDQLVKISARNISNHSHNRLPNGLICLKGGDLGGELGRVRRPMLQVPLTDYFKEDYFKEKYLIYVEI